MVTLAEHLKKIQTLGGKAVVKKYGKKHFSDLAKKRWEKQKK